MRTSATNSGLAKVAVQCSAGTFVVKIATFSKPQNVTTNVKTQNNDEHKTFTNQSDNHKYINRTNKYRQEYD